MVGETHILIVAPAGSEVSTTRPSSVLVNDLEGARDYLDRAQVVGDRVDLVVIALDSINGVELVRFCHDLLDASDFTRIIVRAEPTEWERLLGNLDDDERIVIAPTSQSTEHLWRMVRFASSYARRRERDEFGQQLEQIGQVTAFVAHEMNTPLQFVSDSLHFLVEGWQALSGALERYDAAWDDEHPPFGVDPRDLTFYRANLNEVSSRMSQGLQTIEELASALRRSTPRVDAEPQWENVNDLVRAAVAMTRGAWRQVARLDLDLQELPEIEVLSGELIGVFVNLIMNATHAVESRWGNQRGNIRVATRATDAGVEITFGDNGCGMQPDVASRAFEAHFSTKEVGRGTGQGLAIARRTIEKRHKGEIEFVTRPEEGSTFTVTIPSRFQAVSNEQDDSFEKSYAFDETMLHQSVIGR